MMSIAKQMQTVKAWTLAGLGALVLSSPVLAGSTTLNKEMSRCINTCADRYMEPAPEFQLRRRGDTPPPGPGDFVNRCPKDTTLTPFEMPIYDEDGLFVIGYETVWFCLPNDLEPAD